MIQILYGLHTVKAALANPKRHHKSLFVTEKSIEKLDTLPKNLSVHIVSGDHFSTLVPEGAVHQQVVLETTPLPFLTLEDYCKRAPSDTRIVILDQVTDPQNVGSILRTCAAFGVHALLVPGSHSGDLQSPLLAKIASGALEYIPLIHGGNLAHDLRYLKEQGFWCYGLDERGTPIGKMKSWNGKVALLFGAEGKGLRTLTKKSCDQLLSLPTSPQFPTLNVGATVAATLYATTAL